MTSEEDIKRDKDFPRAAVADLEAANLLYREMRHWGYQRNQAVHVLNRIACCMERGNLDEFRFRFTRKGNPYDNAVIEPANMIPKKELIYRRAFADPGQLRRELNPYIRWCNEERIHSKLGCMSLVEFRNAGLSL